MVGGGVRLAWLVCLLVLVTWPCSSFGGTPTAVATIFPVGDLMRSLAGPSVAVSVLLPARANPHSFALKPAQARVVADAALFVSVGGGFDRWAERFAKEGHARRLSLLEAMGRDSAGGNPHVWLDPLLVKARIVPLLARALSELVPEQSEAIRRRENELSRELIELDRAIRLSLKGMPKSSFIAMHSAWGLFARRYGLRELAVSGLEEAEPSPARLARIIKLARELGVKRLIAEEQSGWRVAAVLAQELGGEVVEVDPLGGANVPGRDGYFALMRFNLRAFARALQ